MRKDGTRGVEGDGLGNRMKWYERQETARYLIPLLPIIIRLDGRAFHSFTKGLRKPWDQGLTDAMVQVTKNLVKETNARIGYTQSDEISLIISYDEFSSEPYFNGKLFKITSLLSSLAGITFDRLIPEYLPTKVGRPPALFDCRVWNVPNKEEAVNYLIWREQDAIRNSVSMAAQALFSHGQLMYKDVPTMKEMMLNLHGVDWNAYPAAFKQGTYVRRYEIQQELTKEAMAKLPEGMKNITHVARSQIGPVQMPILTTIKNRVDVIFNDAPVVFKEPKPEL